MHLSDATVVSILKKSSKIKPETLAEMTRTGAKAKGSLQDLILQKKLLSEAELTQLYAQEIGAQFIELGGIKIDSKTLNRIPEHIARQYQAVLFESGHNGNKLAISDPGDLQAVDFLQKLLGTNTQIYAAPASQINRALDQYRTNLDKEITRINPADEVAAAAKEVRSDEVAEDSPTAKTTNLIIEYAIKQEASDIHIEPREDGVQIRYRIDGVLREANALPKNVLSALVSRIKIMANLKIDEHRKPQDGRFKITQGDRIIAVRVSTLPVMDGEKIVMRLLDESTRALTLEELGFNAGALERMQRAMTQPHGLILVTGPTGSGKSTTLYSVLSTLNTAGVNISTVEDPVEYRIAGVNQTQVNSAAGVTFASGLRALLRQDPNIIMVGEIRDSETADLAIQAALTGHLVLSTLHTNNAATSLPRLLDMGAESFLIASTVRVVIGQRLVRKLCSKCRISYQPDEKELESLEHQLGVNPRELIVSSKPDSPAAPMKLWKAGKGCDACNLSGYKGRMGIYEVLEVSEELAKLITNRATSDDIQRQAISDGMVTMQRDGLAKAASGLTTVAEILRVTRE
jgi:type IV pilus assembly protein PilB